jgi:cell division protein FtsA
MSSTKHTLINRSAIVYELDDARRVANPVGVNSEILKGKLSFVLCSNYFIEAVKSTLELAGITSVECVSSALAEALYLVEPEKRDRIAVLVDVGYITSTFSIIQGDGILYQNSFDYGGGYITAALMQELDVSFEEAEKIKHTTNLAQVNTSSYDVVEGDNGRVYSYEQVKKTIKNSLDTLCENLSNSMENSGYVIPEYVSLMITGGGISYIRGAKEHVSGRLDTVVEVASSPLPLMDKPEQSSVLSLLDLALDQI